jgi:hypothetical protein
VSARPAEDAAYAAKQAQLAQTIAQCGQNLHGDEVMAAHQGQPSIAVQDRTHGAGIPAADHGLDDRAKLA